MQPELEEIIESLLDTIEPGHMPDETILSLHTIFNTTLIAALDLIDTASVIRHTTSWSRTFYLVHGSTDSYSVFPNLDPQARQHRNTSGVPPFCTCPTFAHIALLSNMQSMCKHLLAVRVAERLGKFVDVSWSENDLAGHLSRINY